MAGRPSICQPPGTTSAAGGAATGARVGAGGGVGRVGSVLPIFHLRSGLATAASAFPRSPRSRSRRWSRFGEIAPWCPQNVSMVGAGVMVPQVSSPMGMGAALTTESGGNVTRPVSSTVPVTAVEGAGLVEDRDRARDRELCPGLHHGELHGSAPDVTITTPPSSAAVIVSGPLIGARDIWNLRLRGRRGWADRRDGAAVPAARRGGHDDNRASGQTPEAREVHLHAAASHSPTRDCHVGRRWSTLRFIG